VALQRIATRTSLISLALGFSLLGTLIILNRHQADLSDLPDGSSIAVAGGVGAIIVGAVFHVATFLHWKFCAKRFTRLLIQPPRPPVVFSRPEPATDQCHASTAINLAGENYANR
jgi:hypothetical protein